MEWKAQDCGISKAAKDTSMLSSKIDQTKVSHETRSEANFGFGPALMPSYLRRKHFSVFGCSHILTLIKTQQTLALVSIQQKHTVHHSALTVKMITTNGITKTTLLVMSQFYLHIIDNIKIHSFL